MIGDSGRLAPYGTDVWKLEQPIIAPLADSAAEILRDNPRFKRAARAQAESALGLEKMVDAYLKVLLD